MTDVQLKDFRLVSGLSGVTFVLVQDGGEGARVDPQVVLSALTAHLRPSIDDQGIWHIGTDNTGVLAKAQTPVLRFRDSALEWKYTLEGDESYRPLMFIAAELQNFFGQLTDEERQRNYVLRVENMTPAEITILQKPAADKANEVQLAEDERVKAETARDTAEKARATAETERDNTEKQRQQDEQKRQQQETARQTSTSTAISNAEHATAAANTATSKTNAAIAEAEKQASHAKTQGDYAKEQGDYAKTQGGYAGTQGDYAKTQGDAAKTASSAASDATALATAATTDANEVAQHPTYVGTDFYIYEYDLATHQYNKTQKLVKAASFTIDYNFSSMDDLLAHQPVGQNDNLFAIINTQDTEDEDNAKLFISKNGKWQYVVDMSGFRGFQGYTPQLFTGTTTVGSNRTDAAVSVTENGRDENNNPKYLINFRVPAFSYSDYTPDQIAELQKPALDAATAAEQATAAAIKDAQDKTAAAIKDVNDTNASVRQQEEDRATAEQQRAAAEQTRANQETARVEEEQRRVQEVDSLLSTLQQFDVTVFEQRLRYVERNATYIGDIVGEDDDIDPAVFSQPD